VSEIRIPPRPAGDWDAAVFDALSVLRPPGTARSSPDHTSTPDQRSPESGRRHRPVSNLLGIFSWHPALTKAFLVFNNHLFSSTLSDRDRELVTVRVAWLRRGEYEWAQHVGMARAAGLSDAEIGAISDGPEAALWDPRDAVLLRSVDEIVADRNVSDETWQRLAEHLDRQQLMDLVFTIGTYDLLAMAFNVFGVQLEPGLAGFPPGES
jgi:4-carboxymuconolactone decarboxylase